MPSTHYHIRIKSPFLLLETMWSLSPVSLATHMALVMPGALQILPVVFNNFSAFLHVHSSYSAEIVLIPHFSGGMERHFVLALDTYELLLAMLSSNGVQDLSRTFFKCFCLWSHDIKSHLSLLTSSDLYSGLN